MTKTECTLLDRTFRIVNYLSKEQLESSKAPITWRDALACTAFEWPCLSPTEVAVLLFIFNRTLRFRKDRERIPQRHFIRGVYKIATGEIVTTPCHVKNHATLEKSLRRLEAMGIISIDRTGTTHMYQVNFHVLKYGCCSWGLLNRSMIKDGSKMTDLTAESMCEK